MTRESSRVPRSDTRIQMNFLSVNAAVASLSVHMSRGACLPNPQSLYAKRLTEVDAAAQRQKSHGQESVSIGFFSVRGKCSQSHTGARREASGRGTVQAGSRAGLVRRLASLRKAACSSSVLVFNVRPHWRHSSSCENWSRYMSPPQTAQPLSIYLMRILSMLFTP